MFVLEQKHMDDEEECDRECLCCLVYVWTSVVCLSKSLEKEKKK